MSNKCLGIVGAIFGHKFRHCRLCEITYDHCQRCGRERGAA